VSDSFRKDLLKIKKLYGEEMMHFCKKHFPTLLEEERLLPELLLKNFAPSKLLYNDIIDTGNEENFRKYILFLAQPVDKKEVVTDKTPRELLDEAGYILYECQTEDDIQKFRKYYADNEILCTFSQKRSKTCYVFFAVKKDVEQIKREDIPKRDDAYGRSVISIQFSRGELNTLSIKNRYNHTVTNPDATFSNNLENIIPGLTYSFKKNYGLNINQNSISKFEIPGYVRANDGKFYKYNYEINNIYYCSNNVIIDNFEVKKYEPHERYIVLDYFVIDLSAKTIELYDKTLSDCFPDSIKDIQKISVVKSKETGNKRIKIECGADKIIIVIDSANRIIEYINNQVIEIGDNFLKYSQSLQNLELSNVRRLGNDFMGENRSLIAFSAVNLEQVGNNCLKNAWNLEILQTPALRIVGDEFLASNQKITILDLFNLIKVGNGFFRQNENLEIFNAFNLKVVGDGFLECNRKLKKVYFEHLIEMGNDCLKNNEILLVFNAPNLKSLGDGCLRNNKSLTWLELLMKLKRKVIDEEEKYHRE